MKILIASFCKTGTKSVEKALEILGYAVPDYWTLNIKNYERWKQYMRGDGCLDDLRVIYQGMDVASDMPANMYWKDFLKAFPDIKLIMMLRDEEQWLRSWKRHWNGRNNDALLMPLSIFSPTARKCIKIYHLEATTFFRVPQKSFRSIYQGISDQKLREVYREHNRNIVENAPADRLLVLNLKDGWAPLCEFLGKDIPTEEFPHCNKRGGLVHDQRAGHPLFKKMYLEMYITLAAIGSIILLILVLLVWTV